MINVFWFRRDLRLEDNAGLYYALKSGLPILPIFIFDKIILDQLKEKSDPRVTFIFNTIVQLRVELQSLGSDLKIFYGKPAEVWQSLVKNYDIDSVYANHDYESYAVIRDKQVKDFLISENIKFLTYKDHVIFERSEVVKDDGKPYTVFTPYKRKWLSKLGDNPAKSSFLRAYPTQKYFSSLYKFEINSSSISLEEMGFSRSTIFLPEKSVAQSVIKLYDQKRDFPALDATSKLGIHFRFGTISIREKAHKALAINDIYLSELIWRDFYAQILFHFPHVEKGAFRPEYDRIPWINDSHHFDLWCKGQTGYPIVDAGMRQLAQTGYMHNRVRMIVASFLTKHLLIDWRWGEAWFAQKLLDFDLASNNGGWQWAAGSGTDAAPYFRVFSPDAQTERFDKEYKYIKKWVPEFGTDKYPKPIVDHKMARERCLKVYKEGLQESRV